jgi:hypothetical protein
MSTNSKYKKKVQDELKDRERRLILKHRYETRITSVKQGKQAFAMGDFVTAIRRYTEYLETIAEVHGLSGIYDIKPDHFHKTKDVTEMMMLSHLYYELAKVYDATGKFHGDVEKCLDQFVTFSVNQPYQVVNSEMARKHMNKFKFKNHEFFMRAYQQIFVKSRKCYVATHCLGELHPETQRLRLFKAWLLKKPAGLLLVSSYYRTSSPLVQWLDRNPRHSRLFNSLTRPCLMWFSTKVVTRIMGQ